MVQREEDRSSLLGSPVSTSSDTGGNSVGNSGAGEGGPGIAERPSRLATGLHQRVLTSATVEELFQEYSSYESQLLWETSEHEAMDRRPAKIGHLISESHCIINVARCFECRRRFSEDGIHEGLETTAGMYRSADEVVVGKLERGVANILKIDLQMGADYWVGAVAAGLINYVFKDPLSAVFVPDGNWKVWSGRRSRRACLRPYSREVTVKRSRGASSGTTQEISLTRC